LDGEPGTIRGILPRRGILSRKVPGEETEEQILGSNIDKVLVVYALDGGRSFTARGLERYLTLVWEGGAQPLLVLNKLDLCTDLVPFLNAVEESAPGVPLFLISATEGEGVESLRSALKPGETVVLIGPSGVGKSSLINALGREELQKTGDRREADRRGRHTTTHRELFRLPSGLLLLDSPGLREMQLWGSGENAGKVFPEVELLADQCRFRDCSHNAEPGCAVREALEQGTLAEERFNSYQELQRELAYLNRREDDKAAREDKIRWKKISQFAKELNKDRKRRYN
jgi:ribosome biogenesis GTPase